MRYSPILCSVLILLQVTFGFGQIDDDIIHEVEDSLAISLPKDYLDMIQSHQMDSMAIAFQWDIWTFWSLPKVISETQRLRRNKVLDQSDIAVADDGRGSILFGRKRPDWQAYKYYWLDREADPTFYLLSLCELTTAEQTERLKRTISATNFRHLDLSEIRHCYGSLYNYAMELYTEEDHHNYARKRNEKAMELFYLVAAMGHPDAAHQIADHFEFQENTEVEKVLEWRRKAVAYGSLRGMYELADFIIDYKKSAIPEAIQLLERLIVEVPGYRARAALKLSRVYMREGWEWTDFDKGIKYVRIARGGGNYNGTADLAFYYYRGKGLEKDVHKALELLKEANQKAIERLGSGWWDEEIALLEKELKN